FLCRRGETRLAEPFVLGRRPRSIFRHIASLGRLPFLVSLHTLPWRNPQIRFCPAQNLQMRLANGSRRSVTMRLRPAFLQFWNGAARFTSWAKRLANSASMEKKAAATAASLAIARTGFLFLRLTSAF